eukprot:c16567_g1_i1.p1 GENE.c16567_g1_i1~~c16567_g1_i1.p1  ORF type:complete len:337 (-),score=64.09 c16567_g1_i1:105-1115(-)
MGSVKMQLRLLVLGCLGAWGVAQVLDDKPRARSDHAMVVRASDAIFLFGGMDSSRKLLNDFWRFSLGDNTWVQIGSAGPRPQFRCWHAMSVKTDFEKMYLFGGFNSTHSLNDLWRYSFASNEWQTISPTSAKPFPRDRHTLVTAGNSLIVYGGYNSEMLGDMWRYSIDENTWTRVDGSAPSSGGPGKRRSHSAAMYRNRMFVFGGNNGHHALQDTWQFDFDTSAWLELSSSRRPSRRSRARLVADGYGNLYMFGGYDGANFKFDLWTYQNNEGWMLLDPNNDRPIERADHSVVYHTSQRTALDKGRLFVFGGFDGQSKYGDMHKYEIGTNSWERIV